MTPESPLEEIAPGVLGIPKAAPVAPARPAQETEEFFGGRYLCEGNGREGSNRLLPSLLQGLCLIRNL